MRILSSKRMGIFELIYARLMHTGGDSYCIQLVREQSLSNEYSRTWDIETKNSLFMYALYALYGSVYRLRMLVYIVGI